MMPSDVANFLSGMIAMGFLVGALFFLRFWRQAKDGLFLAFALAFFLFALGQTLTSLVGPSTRGTQLDLFTAFGRIRADHCCGPAEKHRGRSGLNDMKAGVRGTESGDRLDWGAQGRRQRQERGALKGVNLRTRLRCGLRMKAQVMRLRLWRLAVAITLLFASIETAHAHTVALTFDDLPVFGNYAEASEAKRITTKLLDGLRRRHWRAIGFVNEIELDAPDRDARIALLSQWLDAGMDLGNHSYSHMSLTNAPVDAYIADVAKGGAVTNALLAARGRKEGWYRYPFLETGTTLEIRRHFETWLAAHGYRVAPVTMENADWGIRRRV